MRVNIYLSRDDATHLPSLTGNLSFRDSIGGDVCITVGIYGALLDLVGALLVTQFFMVHFWGHWLSLAVTGYHKNGLTMLIPRCLKIMSVDINRSWIIQANHVSWIIQTDP